MSKLNSFAFVAAAVAMFVSTSDASAQLFGCRARCCRPRCCAPQQCCPVPCCRDFNGNGCFQSDCGCQVDCLALQFPILSETGYENCMKACNAQYPGCELDCHNYCNCLHYGCGGNGCPAFLCQQYRPITTGFQFYRQPCRPRCFRLFCR